MMAVQIKKLLEIQPATISNDVFEFGIGGKNCRISLQHSIVILIDSLVSLVYKGIFWGRLGLVFSIAVKQKAVNICIALFDKFIRIDTLIFSTTFLNKKRLVLG